MTKDIKIPEDSFPTECCANCGSSHLISLENLPVIGCVERNIETYMTFRCGDYSEADDTTGGGLFAR